MSTNLKTLAKKKSRRPLFLRRHLSRYLKSR
jgi:hypothetical protein